MLDNSKEDKLIKIGIDEGNNIFFDILDNYPELDKNDPRQTSVLFALMTNCIVHLHISGYTEKELVNEVFDHCKLARDIMNNDA